VGSTSVSFLFFFCIPKPRALKKCYRHCCNDLRYWFSTPSTRRSFHAGTRTQDTRREENETNVWYTTQNGQFITEKFWATDGILKRLTNGAVPDFVEKGLKINQHVEQSSGGCIKCSRSVGNFSRRFSLRHGRRKNSGLRARRLPDRNQNYSIILLTNGYQRTTRIATVGWCNQWTTL